MDRNLLFRFVEESNRIENIHRIPSHAELKATEAFLDRDRIEVLDMMALVKTYAGADLRDKEGMNVRVGNHVPSSGGPHIKVELEELLLRANSGDEHPYWVHQDYETLHPFIDGNGRSGRALWAWMMLDQGVHPGIRLGFLHCWYYQSLEHYRIGP